MSDWKSRLQDDLRTALTGFVFRAGRGFSRSGKLLVVKGLVIRRDGKVCDIEISVRPYALKEGEGEGWQTSPLVGELRAMAEAPDPHVRAEALRDLALLEGPRIPREDFKDWPIVLKYFADANHDVNAERRTDRAGRVVYLRVPSDAICHLRLKSHSSSEADRHLYLKQSIFPPGAFATRLAAAGASSSASIRRTSYTSDDPRWVASLRELKGGGTELTVLLSDPDLAKQAGRVEFADETHVVRFRPMIFGDWSAAIISDRTFEDVRGCEFSVTFFNPDSSPEGSG